MTLLGSDLGLGSEFDLVHSLSILSLLCSLVCIIVCVFPVAVDLLWALLVVLDFHCISSLSYITHLEVDVLVSSMCVCLCVSVCVLVCFGLSTLMHKRYLIFQCTTTMVSSYKQTHPCLQMKTNIDEIKLGKEYLISELNAWIKLGFLYWIKPVGIGSISSIWENRGGKTFSFFLFGMYIL